MSTWFRRWMVQYGVTNKSTIETQHSHTKQSKQRVERRVHTLQALGGAKSFLMDSEIFYLFCCRCENVWIFFALSPSHSYFFVRSGNKRIFALYSFCQWWWRLTNDDDDYYCKYFYILCAIPTLSSLTETTQSHICGWANGAAGKVMSQSLNTYRNEFASSTMRTSGWQTYRRESILICIKGNEQIIPTMQWSCMRHNFFAILSKGNRKWRGFDTKRGASSNCFKSRSCRHFKQCAIWHDDRINEMQHNTRHDRNYANGTFDRKYRANQLVNRLCAIHRNKKVDVESHDELDEQSVNILLQNCLSTASDQNASMWTIFISSLGIWIHWINMTNLCSILTENHISCPARSDWTVIMSMISSNDVMMWEYSS